MEHEERQRAKEVAHSNQRNENLTGSIGIHSENCRSEKTANKEAEMVDLIYQNGSREAHSKKITTLINK
jgi:hypothetical protein